MAVLIAMVDPEVEELFKDAENLYQESLRELEAGRIRKAAESAWGGTAKATDALLYACARVDIVRGLGRTREIYELTDGDPDVEASGLMKEYNDRILHLHGNCFYEGICKIPGVDLEKLIMETGRYVESARKLSLNK